MTLDSSNLRTIADSMMILEMWISTPRNQAETSLCEKTLSYHCFNPQWWGLEFIEENNLVLSRAGNQMALGKCCPFSDGGVAAQCIFDKISDLGELLLHPLWKAPGDKDYLETWATEIIQSSIQFKKLTTQLNAPRADKWVSLSVLILSSLGPSFPRGVSEITDGCISVTLIGFKRDWALLWEKNATLAVALKPQIPS